jgi:hypothetical protein
MLLLIMSASVSTHQADTIYLDFPLETAITILYRHSERRALTEKLQNIPT